MAFIICGNGFFKPNISSMVGTLYQHNDPRKDSAFSIFYMGINSGAALGGLLCGYVGERINWHYGFGLAGIFMILGLVVFTLGKRLLTDKGLPPNVATLKKKIAFLTTEQAIYLGTIIIVPLVVALFNVYVVMNYVMIILGVLSFAYVLSIAFKLPKVERFQLFAALIMITFSTLFWAFYEQNAGSLNLFAIRNVNMNVLGYNLPPLSVNNFLPPAWVITLSYVFAQLWTWLGKKGKEPSTPLKFALSFIFVGIGFYVFFLGCKLSVATGLISMVSFVFGYFFIICGELCLSPIGLSMITKLSPKNIVGMMMGIWFFAMAVGEFLAGKIGSLMSIPKSVADTTNPVQSLPYYAKIISEIGLASLIIGIILICLVPLLRKWMFDVK